MKFTVTLTLEAETKDDIKPLIDLIGGKDIEIKQQRRTTQQNRGLHKYFELIEQEAREKGLTMDLIVTKPNNVPITRYLLKDLFRMIGFSMFKKESTKDLTNEEMGEVIETFQRIIAKRLDITLEFPTNNI